VATHRIRRLDPVSVGKISAVLYGLLGLLFVPLLLLMSVFSPDTSGVGLGLALAMPIGYAVFGAISSMIAAALYNLVAGWVGGLEFEVE
jgi:hypothetical protein